MRTISGQLHVARQLLMQNKAWLLFVEIPLRTGAYFRLVRSIRHVQADGKIWQACAIAFEAPSEDAAGSLGRLVLGVPNVSRMPMAYVEIDDESGEPEILGAAITCWLGHETRLGVGELEDGLSWRHTVLAVDADAQTLRVECGHPAAFEQGPRARFDRLKFPQMLAQRP
jgi:hypothetical protein